AIDALSHASIMISQRHLDSEKTAIADNYLHKTLPIDTPEQHSKTAKVINTRKATNSFEDVFVVQKKSIYADKDHLTLLTKKAK
ncbi:10400_t:CDS:2, partial [Racocetra persica]